jgi:5'-3' exonuclease
VAPILLLDTYSLLFRAHHALPEMNTTGGEPTSALASLLPRIHALIAVSP